MELMQDTLNRLRSEGYKDEEIAIILWNMTKEKRNVR